MSTLENRILVIVPAYNCRRWLTRCFASINDQEYTNYKVIVIDDASPDRRQPDTIQRWCGLHDNWQCVLNGENLKCPYNIVQGIELLNPEDDDIILIVDGDDFLAHNNVFSRVNEMYSESDAWLIYTQYEPHPENTGQAPSADYAEIDKQQRSYRDIGSLFNHLITFKYKLWKHLPLEQLKDDNGIWFRVCYDRAIMVPLLELAGSKWRFYDEVMYRYNSINPLSDHIQHAEEANRIRNIINRRPKLDRIDR